MTRCVLGTLEKESNTHTVELNLIATEMLAFPSEPSRNNNYSDLMTVILYMRRQLLNSL